MKRRQPRYTLLPYATLFRSLRRLNRVDVDPAQLHKNAPADVAVLGDARSVLERLPVRTASEDLRSVRAAIREEALADGAPWLDLVGALDETLGPHGVLAGDSTMAAYYGAVHFLPMDARRRSEERRVGK